MASASARAAVARGTAASSSAVRERATTQIDRAEHVSALSASGGCLRQEAIDGGSAARHAGDVVQVADAAVLVAHDEDLAAVFEHEGPRGGSDPEDRDAALVDDVALFR